LQQARFPNTENSMRNTEVLPCPKIVVDRKDPLDVAQETNHSIRAVDRYMKDFNRVRLCHEDGKNPEFISLATGLNRTVVKKYLQIIEDSRICS